MMGIATDIQNGTPNILANPTSKAWYEAFQEGGQAAGKAAYELITMFAQYELPEELVADYSPGRPNIRLSGIPLLMRRKTTMSPAALRHLSVLNGLNPSGVQSAP